MEGAIISVMARPWSNAIHLGLALGAVAFVT
jgi:hypothetical protein